MRRVISLVALIVLPPLANVAAQDRSPDHQERRWAVSGILGGTIGGSSAQIERAMTVGGLNQTSQCWFFCTGVIDHPFTRRDGISRTVMISYTVRPRLQARLHWGTADLGTTFGYGGELGSYLFLQQSVTSVAVLPAVTMGDFFRVGVGPAIESISIKRTNARGGPGAHATKVGLVFDAGLTIPSHSRLFLDMGVQYHYSGSTEVGPFETENPIYGIAHSVPRTGVSFNYTFVSVGLGVRF